MSISLWFQMMLSCWVRSSRSLVGNGVKMLSTYSLRDPCCSHSSGLKFVPQLVQSVVNSGQPLNYYLPSSIRSSLTYTFPTVESSMPKLAPTCYLEIAQLDPMPLVEYIKAPEYNHHLPEVEKLAVRMIVVRHKKIKKHKRRKYRKRDKFLWAKKQRNKKMKAEKEFRQRCGAMLAGAVNFDADKHVEEFLEKCKWKPSQQVTESGKKIYPHWTELMTVEQLYGLPETDYIDKTSGLPDADQWEEIKKLRQLALERNKILSD